MEKSYIEIMVRESYVKSGVISFTHKQFKNLNHALCKHIHNINGSTKRQMYEEIFAHYISNYGAIIVTNVKGEKIRFSKYVNNFYTWFAQGESIKFKDL